MPMGTESIYLTGTLMKLPGLRTDPVGEPLSSLSSRRHEPVSLWKSGISTGTLPLRIDSAESGIMQLQVTAS